MRLKFWRSLICFLILVQSCWSTGLAQRGFAMGNFYKTDTILVENTTPDAMLFKKQMFADVIHLTVEGLEPGNLTIQLAFIETQYDKAEQRGMAIFANNTMLTPNLDIYNEAGGKNKPLLKSFKYDFDGGRLDVALNGIGVPAEVCAIRVFNKSGKLIAQGITGSMRKDRISANDNRTRPMKVTTLKEVPFYNVDHSPLGAYSTLVYGMEASGGIQTQMGRPLNRGDVMPHRGVTIAVKQGNNVKVMPFVTNFKESENTKLIKPADVTHQLSVGSDSWKISPEVSWKHYMPYWSLPDIEKATEKEIATFVLPATWMEFTLDNNSGSGELELLFGLQGVTAQTTSWGDYTGYVVDKNSALAVKATDASLISSEDVKTKFNIDSAGNCFLIKVPAHSKKAITIVSAFYNPAVTSQIKNENIHFLYTHYYKDMGDVIQAAFANSNAAITNANNLDARLQKQKLSGERSFQVAQSLQSYRYNTGLYEMEKSHAPVWTVMEGEYGYINTFDLTIDHLFHELAMHPWTVKNELNMFEKYYSYTDSVRYRDSDKRYLGGIGFTHDMGAWLKFSDGTMAYGGAPMTQEELQNWILCAGVYWKKTGDNKWLVSKQGLLEKCLRSMQIRDDVDSSKRDGITSMLSCVGTKDQDITTYDAMDKSLKQPDNSLYIGVKSFASYLALQSMFEYLGNKQLAFECADAARKAAKTIGSYWNAQEQYFPAVFTDPNNKARVIPAVEGLIYPYMMGLKKDVSTDGPYGDLISKLKTHLRNAYKSNVNSTGGILLSPTSGTTWESKVFLSEYIAQQVLGLDEKKVFDRADKIQMSYQILGAPAVGWSDQIRKESGTAYGGRHYPRGVTTALWWLY